MKEFAMSVGTKMRPTTSRHHAPSGAPLKRSPHQISTRGNKLGNAKASHDRYVVLARAAASAGDQVEAENLYQHAEHYCRLMRPGIDEHGAEGHNYLSSMS